LKSVLVVGNGLIGACTALALQREGLHVVVVDIGDDRAAASHGNAGHLATEQVVPLASQANLRSLVSRLFVRGGPVAFPPRDIAAWLPFGLNVLRASSPAQLARGTQALQSLLAQAIPAWQRVASHLQAAHLIRADGHWMVWESAASAARGLAAWQRAPLGSAHVHPARDEECQALQTRFGAHVHAAARFEGTGQVTDLPALRMRLQNAFEAAGGEVRHARAVQLIPQQGAVVLADGQMLQANVMVVAAGIGSAALLKPFVPRVPLIAERGYHVEVARDGRAPLSALATPQGLPVVFEDRSLILAPFASSLRLSSFTEFSTANAPADARKWRRLEQHAHALGVFDDRAPVQRWIGSRPTLPDYLPALGQHPIHKQLFYAFGHNHLGVTMAAITGELMADLMLARPSKTDCQAFDLQRFE
jgi:D-hydroxyproline dehydrogenase